MKRPFLAGLAAALLLAASGAAGATSAAGAPLQRAFVVIETEDDDDEAWRRIADILERHGARLPLRLPPDTLVGRVPPGIEGEIARIGLSGVRIERSGGPAIPGALPPNARAARRFLSPLDPPPGVPAPGLLRGDHVEPLPGEIAPAPKSLPTGCERSGSTSSVLVGSVAVGILLPESLGPEDTESWATEDPAHPGVDRQDLIVSEILQGCDELVAEHPEAGLSFVLEVRRSVGIPLEPILHAVPDRGGWLDATLTAIGHGAASPSAGTGGYVRALRERLDTDWAAAAYVADDLVDADNGFPPTGFPFAYALLGGPYMVMTYGNDGWGIDRMNAVFRHELGHVFHALDEYRSAGNSCGATAGWLVVKNGNNDSAPGDPACETADACFMRGQDTTAACAFTAGQVGIRDLDGNGLIDVLDAPPDSGFEADTPLLVTASDVVLVARASSRSRPEESPHASPGLALNRVAAAEVRLDGGAWTPLAPRDGGFGDRCEDFDVALTSLPEGWHDVELRATNDRGAVEPSPALLRVYVNADCADDASEPDDSSDQAVTRSVGSRTLHRCAYDSDWSRFYLRAGAAVSVTLDPADASRPLTLRLLDPAGAEMRRADAAGAPATIAAVAAATGVHRVVVEAAHDHETDYVLTIDAACVDDADEPDSPAPAGFPAYPGILRSRMLCAGDEDMLLVGMQAGETLQADLAFDPAFGDLDLEILDPSGAVAASSLGTGSPEVATITPTTEGVHAIRVFGKTPSDGNAYDVTISATGCADDPGENDDDASQARLMAAGDTVRGATCADDEDWLAFEVTSRRLVRVLLAHDPAAGNLDLELHDASGRIVGRSTRAGGSELIASERLAPGTHFVRIRPTGTGRVAWTLQIEVVDPLLLFVREDPADALLTWNRSDQECFTLRRSLDPSDFSGAVTTLIQEGDPSVITMDRPIQDVGHRDDGVIIDGVRLYCYLVDPHDCGVSLVGSVKIARPYPVLGEGIGTLPSLEYEIVLANSGIEDVFGAVFRDDLPAATDTFTVLEIPPGATDASLPAPAGAEARGQVVVTGIAVPAGEERTVRFGITVNARVTTLDPMIDNQGVAEAGASPVVPPQRFPTDDGLTTVFGDDTRVLHATFAQQLTVQAFWHRAIDLDLVITDPCGNELAEHAMLTADCAGQTGRVLATHSCAAPSPPDRYEKIVWSGWPPPPGEYVAWAEYRAFAPDDPDCASEGPDEITVVVHGFGMPVVHRTVTIDPGAGRVEVLRFVR